jgi:hypothetical protein
MSDASKALALLPSDSEWAKLKEVGSNAFKSGLIPSTIKNAEAATIIALKAYELGLPPMVGFSHIHVVNGRPGCSAELLLAGIRKEYPKVSIQYVESNEKICKIKVKRPDDDFYNEFQFTIEEAKAAGLLGKDVWKNYPTDMLRARAITRMKRAIFPEVLMGLDHTAEELELTRDVTPKGAEAPQATQTESGEVVIQSFAQSEEAAVEEKQAAPAAGANPAPLKNYAPQTAEEAKNWKPGDSDPRKDQPKEPPPAEPPPSPDKRAIIGKDIGLLAVKLKLTATQMKAKSKKFFGKEEAFQLTTQELELLRDILKNEVENASPAK